MIAVDEQFDITYVDPSGIGEANRCLAKYMFSRLMGLVKADEVIIPLDYGTDMHCALPYCHNGMSGLKRATDEFSAHWNGREHGDIDEKRNKSTAAASLEGFCAQHEPSTCPYEIMNLDHIKAPTFDRISPNEVPFLIDIGGPLSLAGRMDAIVIWKADGTVWAMDYKTASEISARYFDSFWNCPQALGYTLAATHLVPDKTVSGMIIDAVRTSKKNVENQMHPIFVREHQLESFIRFANSTAEAILGCNRTKTWPKRCTGCAPYAMFGMPGRVCPFKAICDSPDWKSMLKYYKKKEPFHPFKVSKGEQSGKV